MTNGAIRAAIPTGKPLHRLRDVLSAHHSVNGWVILDSILAQDSAYRGRSVLTMMMQGDDESLDRVIQKIEEQYS